MGGEMQVQKEKRPAAGGGLEALRERYRDDGLEARMESTQAVLGASFSKVEKEKERLGAAFGDLQAAYADAQTVAARRDLPGAERQQLLYAVYDAYFARLAALPWRLRRPVGADGSIRAMRLAMKGGQRSASWRYWLRFLQLCAPFFVVGFGGEIVFLMISGTEAPLWQVAVSFVAFVGGFAGYIAMCYHLEGQRLHGDLQRWMRYRTAPQEFSRPIDALQAGKMVLPLLIAVGSALIKQVWQ